MDDTIAVLNGAIADATKLLNLHLELLRAEAKKNAGYTARIALLAFLMILGLIPALILLTFGISDLLHTATQMTDWQSKLVVSAICFGICSILAYYARSQIIQLQDKQDD